MGRAKSKVKSSGQECPHHTGKTNVKGDGQECPSYPNKGENNVKSGRARVPAPHFSLHEDFAGQGGQGATGQGVLDYRSWAILCRGIELHAFDAELQGALDVT
jgi:hypothetical protein